MKLPPCMTEIRVTPFMADTAERAGKSALQGFLVGSALDLSGAAVAATSIDWANGLNIALGMLIASVATSLLSYRRGDDRTASLVKAVEYREISETNGNVQ